MSKMTVSIPLKDDDFRVSGWCGNRPQCVKVAIKPQGVAIRDSKDPMKTTLTFTNEEWDAFIRGVKDGQFNPLV